MKKLPQFGYTNNNTYAPDFEWPKPEDILAMPLGKPLGVESINWHNSEHDTAGNYIGAI